MPVTLLAKQVVSERVSDLTESPDGKYYDNDEKGNSNPFSIFLDASCFFWIHNLPVLGVYPTLPVR